MTNPVLSARAHLALAKRRGDEDAATVARAALAEAKADRHEADAAELRAQAQALVASIEPTP